MIIRKCQHIGKILLLATIVLAVSLFIPQNTAKAEEADIVISDVRESGLSSGVNTETVSLKSASRSEVKKLDAALKMKREFILKVGTGSEGLEKTLSDINKKLRKINKAGVVLNFGPEANKIPGGGKTENICTDENGFYLVFISEDNAKTYCGAIDFMNRIFEAAKKNKSSVKTGDSSFANARKVLASASSMSALSDAMKLYAVAASGYFTCSRVSNGFNMTYNPAGRGSFDAQGSRSEIMNTLAAGRASGVCEEYAKYENFVFSLLGIEGSSRRSTLLMHAWSVAKVTNSEGKVMWVPFDYDIGPSWTLSRSAFDPSNTAEMKNRYKIYLEGIEGAPSGKNFENSDFK